MTQMRLSRKRRATCSPILPRNCESTPSLVTSSCQSVASGWCWNGSASSPARSARGLRSRSWSTSVYRWQPWFTSSMSSASSYDDGQKLRNRGVTSLVNQHRDVAPSGAATAIGCIHRAPERLTRRALAAAREQRLGLSAISSLLERDDDEQLWNEIMADHSQATAGSSIVL